MTHTWIDERCFGFRQIVVCANVFNQKLLQKLRLRITSQNWVTSQSWITSQSQKLRLRITRSSRLEMFCREDVLRNFAKFTGKHLYRSIFSNKLKKTLWNRCFPENFAKSLRTLYLQDTSSGYFWITDLKVTFKQLRTIYNIRPVILQLKNAVMRISRGEG